MTAKQRFERVQGIIDRYPIIGIMTLSLAIKLFLLGFDQVINPDGVLYIAAAQQMADGNLAGALKLYPMPSYPMLLALVHLLIPDWIAAARLVGIAALVLASIPLYGITRNFFNRKAAFWATLCFALTPEANYQALSVLRDPVFLLFTLLAIWSFLRGLRERSLKNVFVAFLLAGVSFLFRVEGIVTLVAPILFFAFKAIVCRNDVLKQFARKGLILWIGVPLILGIILSIVFSPQLLSQNRVGQLMEEVHKITHFTAFDNYQEIYRFFQTIETKPPFSIYSKSLPSVIRHWMPVIYMIGLTEYFVKQVFPIFMVPLIWSTLHFVSNRPRTFLAEKQFLLLVWVVYMLFMLYSFMVRDLIQGRFLFTPAVFLYPWVGHGIVLVFQWLKGIRFARILRVVVLLLFIVTPCVKIGKAVVKSDRGALDTGRFISKDANLFDSKIAFSDTRQWLYAQRREAFLKANHMARTISNHIVKGQIKAIENLAINENIDAIVLFINFNKTKTIPGFDRYRVYKQIPSRKGVTVIYKLRES